MNHRSTTIPLKIGFVSLGCAKNLVDSEVMLGSLLRDGMALTENVDEADVVIVNTCGFIEGAKKESIDAVLKASQFRRTGRCKALIMAGCLTQRYPKDLQKELPEVDAIVGLNEVPRIGEIVREVLSRVGQASSLCSPEKADKQDARPALFWSGPAKYVPDYAAPRFRLTPKHYAYVKIAEGCNHPCTFCSIPRIRGRHRSRTVDDVLAEVRALVGDGVREINLISQDTTFYGKDLNGDGVSLASLLRAIQQIPSEFWVRLLYTHPAHWNDELIDTIAACDKVCRYVDMPLQHINDRMLERMRRETDGRYIRDLIRRIRAGIPGIALRSTFIVGFPGETEKEFEELLAFIKEAQFERLGVFTYSQEDHTPAGDMKEQISVKVKKQRYGRAMALQQKVSRTIHERLIGATVRVLIEKPSEGRVEPVLSREVSRPLSRTRARQNTPLENDHGWVGRSHADAPEIDGSVLVHGEVCVGQFADVEITAAREYDLEARSVVGVSA
jgi:ribosomal protein S12 methylthiotransferase